MFIDLSDKKVAVAGAGTIAKRRIRSLLDFTDHLVVIAPEVNQELKQLEADGKLTILRKYYEREDIYDASLVIAATNDKKMNQEISTEIKTQDVIINNLGNKINKGQKLNNEGLSQLDKMLVKTSTTKQIIFMIIQVVIIVLLLLI